MKKILVCQHVTYEPLGTLYPLIKQRGFRVRYTNFAREPLARPGLDKISALILLGGPMNVDEADCHPHLNYEIELIQEALKRDIPVLGICLGAQLIASALGAKVFRNPQPEIGWYPVQKTAEAQGDPVFANFHEEEAVFQWHYETFEIPQGATRLVRSELCANQAFRWGDKVYGFQFHLEADEALIQCWLKVPEHQRQLENLLPVDYAAQIREAMPRHVARITELSNRVFNAFLDTLGHEKKCRQLRSR